jgi:hypothetical protein
MIREMSGEHEDQKLDGNMEKWKASSCGLMEQSHGIKQSMKRNTSWRASWSSSNGVGAGARKE